MGVATETHGSSSVDVPVNLVPFIDLMSCLVAFLLVTAVWTNVSRMAVKPKGSGIEGAFVAPERVELSLLVAQDSLWVGLTTGDRRQVAGGDYTALGETLAEYRAGAMTGRADFELAAEDGVSYQAIIHAMDAALGQGFDDVGFVDPASLSVRFRE